MSRKAAFEQFHYCSWCGRKLDRKAEVCPDCGFQRYKEDPYPGIPAVGSVGAGWSDKINDPRFAGYQKKKRGSALIMYPILLVIIAVILLATGQIELDSEGIYVIGGLFVIFAMFCIGWILSTMKKGKSWEGTVEDKQLKKRIVKSYNHNLERYEEIIHWDTIITLRKPSGRRENIVFKDDNRYYEYLKAGDYVYNHQNRDFRYIEKYDKSLDDTLYCASCGYPNDIRGNFCQSCGCPLIK